MRKEAEKAMEYLSECGKGKYVRKIQDYIHNMEMDNIKLQSKIDNLISEKNKQRELF